MIKKCLEQYLSMEKEIHKLFGYVQEWRVYPIQDMTGVYWCVPQHSDYELRFSQTIDGLGADIGDDPEYSVEVKRIFACDGFTMLHVDTHTDGNQFLYILDNKKKIILPEAR